MNSRVDRIYEKMNEGKLVKGFFLTMEDPAVSEMAGWIGYDYVWIDAEHGALGRQGILRHIVAAQGSGCCAIVRVPSAEPSLLKAILDMGPDGVIFPFIHNAGIAKTAVQACSYPDTGGIRGQGPIRAIRYGLLDEGEYLASGYRNVMRIMQIESLEGYENLDAIMDVEGIDSIFIGAADLSRSIAGYRGDKNYTLDGVYDDICRRVRARGLYLGAAMGPDKGGRRKGSWGKGVQWTVFGQDARALSGALKANFDAVKEF